MRQTMQTREEVEEEEEEEEPDTKKSKQQQQRQITIQFHNENGKRSGLKRSTQIFCTATLRNVGLFHFG